MGKKLSKTRLEESHAGLVEKAHDLSDLAKEQRADADRQRESSDRQHRGAHKLEKLSESLAEKADEIKGELELDAESDQRRPT